jgi:NADH dehydrogenase [ubiquinone] 1 alpha subcomplex assembly factor 7
VVRGAEAGQSDNVNALARKIHALIEAQGPITVAQFMAIALSDAEHGYYMRGDPFGRDFITAPEVSQIFGEIIGLFFVQSWEDRGRPGPFQFVELGPGRGTLMADMMRAASKVRPEFAASARIVLVETSPPLRQAQESRLGSYAPKWLSRLDQVSSDGPLFLVANEFFDALPVRQFVKSERGWHERMVRSEGGALRLALAPDAVPVALIPEHLRDAPAGSVFELNSGASALMRDIASRIAHSGGVALVIDYGHSESAIGETLQAVKQHAFADPLAEPGDADLTAHVDFDALSSAATEAGGRVLGPITQREFLSTLGISARAARLKRDNPERAPEIVAAVERLTEPREMGTLFKVLALYKGGADAAPPGFA